MQEEVTIRFEYDPTFEDTMTRPMVNPIDWQLQESGSLPQRRKGRYILDKPEPYQSWPSHSGGEWQECHQRCTKDADQISDCHHKQSRVSPSSSYNTSNKERDHLEGSPGAVQ